MLPPDRRRSRSKEARHQREYYRRIGGEERAIVSGKQPAGKTRKFFHKRPLLKQPAETDRRKLNELYSTDVIGCFLWLTLVSLSASDNRECQQSRVAIPLRMKWWSPRAVSVVGECSRERGEQGQTLKRRPVRCWVCLVWLVFLSFGNARQYLVVIVGCWDVCLLVKTGQ